MRTVFGISLLLLISCSFCKQSNTYTLAIRNNTNDTLRIVYATQNLSDSLRLVSPNFTSTFTAYGSGPAEQHELSKVEFSQYHSL